MRSRSTAPGPAAGTRAILPTSGPPRRRAPAGSAWTARRDRSGRSDFEEFDLVLAADRRNLADLRAIAPPGTEHKVRLLREFDPASDGAPDLDVPDPYYGGSRGFEEVLDLVEAACRGLVAELRRRGAA